jgi:hypothetical protein
MHAGILTAEGANLITGRYARLWRAAKETIKSTQARLKIKFDVPDVQAVRLCRRTWRKGSAFPVGDSKINRGCASNGGIAAR